jgi:hypothetical protein
MNPRILAAALAALLSIPGCSPPDSSPPDSSREPSAEATGEDESTATSASFINRVWVVAESEQVAPGDLRVFLAEGTFVMASSHGAPALGTWSYRDGRLMLGEEGLHYDVDILELTEDVFRIRIHSHGEPVEIRLEPAEAPPLTGDSAEPSTGR